jgi:hypothetical protein
MRLAVCGTWSQGAAELELLPWVVAEEGVEGDVDTGAAEARMVVDLNQMWVD